ncbi:DUF6676 family protein [Corynebacterium pacaense]|uniref:Rv1476 family membrane protein n=1 Tax=Corynebacterium pacaense TaxID=1816684 RepID=UPI0009BA8BC6|nr:DUF6676 family protein [Corynebacterium pacaense]
MIPENIDIDQIVTDVDDSAVYMGALTAGQYPDLQGDLVAVTRDATADGFGSLGIVVLDQTPEFTASLRDVAQEVLNQSSVDTVAVRAPGSGAVVSEVHSRASLESAQHGFLSTNDYVAGSKLLIRDVTESRFGEIDWAQSSLIVGIVLLVVVVLSAVSVGRRRP